MISTDVHYVRILSTRLEKFRDKGNNTFNFRCPVCGDSDKDKHKTRAYFYPKGTGLNFFCHNCGTSHRLSTFLREYYPDLYQEYTLDLFSNNKSGVSDNKYEQTPLDKPIRSLSLSLTPITYLPETDPARQYLKQRMIPLKEMKYIYYSENFSSFVKEYNEDKNVSFTPRIILPFFDGNMNLMGFQGRSLPQNTHELRYITIKLSETFPKIYGLHRLSKERSGSRPVFVLEGPFDSLFVDNSVAMMGSDIDHKELCSLVKTDNVVYVYDNERRNRQIIQKMKKRVSSGQSVVVWPKDIQQKDVNDMIIAGLTQSDIYGILKDNTFSGLKGEIMIREWSKV